MKLSPRDALPYFRKPDPDAAGLLIHGADAMRVALRRQEVIAALLGPNGEAEMRLTRLAAGDLRKDPATLIDAVKAQGFFPGTRVVFVEDATEPLAKPILTALEDWQPGDAQIIVSAGSLRATSKLRKGFEGHKSAYAAAIYDDPPSRGEIEDICKRAGLRDIDRDAMGAITALAQSLDPGDFRQTVEKLALYKHGDSAPLTAAEVALSAPHSTEAAIDDVLHAVAESRSGDIASVMARLKAQGIAPTTLCIGAMRHFRTLHAAASDPGGVSSGLARARPPVFGPRRDRMGRQASQWGVQRLEDALSLITETDLTLRSAGQTAPPIAVVERAMIRLAMMGRAR